jgi:hypothetical protein
VVDEVRHRVSRRQIKAVQARRERLDLSRLCLRRAHLSSDILKLGSGKHRDYPG